MAKKFIDSQSWEFWIDRGGTFTDVIGRSKEQPELLLVTKLLSESPGQYSDATLEGMRRTIARAERSNPAGSEASESAEAILLSDKIAVARMGTTIGTNALLQRRGDRCALITNRGFKDALRIGYQNRPDIFALSIKLPDMLFERAIELDGRFDACGNEIEPLDLADAEKQLKELLHCGIKSIAIIFMHAYRYDQHEKTIKDLALSIGFEQVSASSEVSPLIRFVSRGDTTVVDAYLTPLLNRYLRTVTGMLPRSRLYFMQSNGGLTPAMNFRGRDCLLSGPAGGVVAAARSAALAGYSHVIGFDMGGTSTDVCHFDGHFERTSETDIQGVKIRTPMMAVHTVAAGGGSILGFDGERCRVGPQSAGANPGPACYRRGGPLTVTDANLLLGRIQPKFFPSIFGDDHAQPLDMQAVKNKFAALTEQIASAGAGSQSPAQESPSTAEQVAEGYLKIAVEIMASAVRKISTQKGHDLDGSALCAFGGAGGQHACQIADELNIKTVLLHPLAGVLSAFGIGIADTVEIAQAAVEEEFNANNLLSLEKTKTELEAKATATLESHGLKSENLETSFGIHLRYRGSDAAIFVPLKSEAETRKTFETLHQKRYGFITEKPIVIESISAEVISRGHDADCGSSHIARVGQTKAVDTVPLFCAGQWQEAEVYVRSELTQAAKIEGPAIIAEETATTVVDPGWSARADKRGFLILEKVQRSENASAQLDNSAIKADPIKLELFSNRLMSIAEEMGIVLQNTSHSVNIKERLDFSCAIFDRHGKLIANAPHIPVHLGSMSESVQSLMQEKGSALAPGDTFIINNPYLGGTHLPDITAISPVFAKRGDGMPSAPDFFVASRGHHADIGGITPGSMPPASKHIEEEGVIFSHFHLAKEGQLNEDALRKELLSAKYPARNPDQNVADLTAQIAANRCGADALVRLCERYGLSVVESYMQFVRNNAASSVRKALGKISEGEFSAELDDGSRINVKVKIDRKNERVSVDFSGTSGQHQGNMNAPRAISKAALLYVFRTIVNDNIPLNDGCLEPVEFAIPEHCILNPQFPAAVVAGNVETSQILVDALYGAMNLMAAAQGTMNNLTFGDDELQYYETICGGAGAGADYEGSSAVHTHMTNSRLTDPEVLELRYPVLLEHFGVRQGSGGAGKNRGGDGSIRRLRFLKPMTVSILSQRRIAEPFGMHGGKPGKRGINKWIKKGGKEELLPGTVTVKVEAADSIQIETPGGGGWGAP
ncbi:MAG: hydantoinase B/oxoprolinase family protein [Candidatus Obscuribacterales bacterium]|nr:hydantoinase B/oxoprolinase family protein [Candidatus Obscuribacterales bacterium]